MAGSLKRAASDLPEEAVLMRALRDMNMPKFVYEDVPLFQGLIQARHMPHPVPISAPLFPLLAPHAPERAHARRRRWPGHDDIFSGRTFFDHASEDANTLNDYRKPKMLGGQDLFHCLAPVAGKERVVDTSGVIVSFCVVTWCHPAQDLFPGLDCPKQRYPELNEAVAKVLEAEHYTPVPLQQDKVRLA